MNKDKKILYFDIETSLMTAVTFGIGRFNVLSDEHILTPSKIICISYRFHNSDTVHHLSWDKNQDDKQMLISFMKVYDKADVTIGQNHKWFDTRHINTRLCYHGLAPMNIMLMDDLLLAAKRALYLPSYKLRYMLKYFNLPHKLSTSGLDLWIDVGIKNNRHRLKDEMIPYCDNDVKILQPLYEKIAPYVKINYNRAIAGEDTSLCSSCGHDKMQLKGYRQSTSLGMRMQVVCLKCRKHQTTGHNMIKKISGHSSQDFHR